MFCRLCEKTNGFVELNRRKNRLKGSILGAVNFSYLPYMLNLQKSAISELLPYLLTAYTFNFWDNRFFYRNQRLVALICTPSIKNDDRIGSDVASKMSQRIKPLSEVFSLKNCKEKPIKSSLMRPAPYLPVFDNMDPKNVKSPYVKYREVLNQVFEIWCEVIEKYGPLAEIDGFPSNVDFEGCRNLYNNYADETAKTG